MSDFDRNYAATRGFGVDRAAALDQGLRAHMIRVYNYMAMGVALTGVVAWIAFQMAGGDAIIFFRRDLARDFDYRRKQAGQLLAKMRFVAAPWVALLESGAWLRNAEHANAMARLLEKEDIKEFYLGLKDASIRGTRRWKKKSRTRMTTVTGRT